MSEEVFGREELNQPIDSERLNNLFSSRQNHKEQKDEIKNKISMALKDPILQQGFEIICKENKELEKENAELQEILDCPNCCELDENECEVCAEFSHFKCKGKHRLAQAKEIIKYLVNAYPIITKETLEKAEQFLNGVNIILEDVQAGNSPFNADEVFNKEMKAYPEEKVNKEIEKMKDEEKQKCLNCVNCDIDGSCIAKQEAPFGDFVCEHNEQFEPLDTGEIEKCNM